MSEKKVLFMEEFGLGGLMNRSWMEKKGEKVDLLNFEWQGKANKEQYFAFNDNLGTVCYNRAS